MDILTAETHDIVVLDSWAVRPSKHGQSQCSAKLLVLEEALRVAAESSEGVADVKRDEGGSVSCLVLVKEVAANAMVDLHEDVSIAIRRHLTA